MPRPKECPACGADMKHLHHAGEHLDECTGCGGVWFDAGELRAYAHAKVVGNLREGTLRHFFKAMGGDARRCPSCGSPALHDGETEGHAISGCDGCGGFFLPPQTLEELEGLSAVRRRRSLFASFDSVDLSYLGEAAVEVLSHLRR